MFEEIIKITGREKGTTSIVLVGVHGDEKCGLEALEKILPTLEIERGVVLFGYGNPRAVEANKRYVGANLNRMFNRNEQFSEKEKESYEYSRAQFLKTYLNKAEALLDIHASRTSTSKPFVICEANATGIIKYLPVERIASGFDQIEPGGTDYYMNSIGKIGICIECGFLGNPQSEQIAEKSIFAFLKARDHIANDLMPQKQSYIRMYDLYKTKTNKFILTKSFDDFEEMSKGQVIGVDGTQEIRAEKAAVILFARNREKVGEEAFLFGEKKNSLA
ncbi:MAG: succinylglutamate desuccinylase/aspartoacylase family protein [Candidatus Sungiibacteriota bacterium]|uniref:Succinylglutamate desuccinylase/aspartoacylase family protein n=1 Tax=Candidatus Sungiibacteriota bacterium TaxID=2750080 RepID=A0A7T5RK00_9BACT|nr:MAG: succinylglutamate desuccinylase/aspartoacylase family protein [Candidatus Sungbacteria bacterium]